MIKFIFILLLLPVSLFAQEVMNKPGDLITLTITADYTNSEGKNENITSKPCYIGISSPLQEKIPNPVFLAKFDELAVGLTIKLYWNKQVYTGLLLNDKRVLIDSYTIIDPKWAVGVRRPLKSPTVMPTIPAPVFGNSLSLTLYKYTAGWNQFLSDVAP